jgi:hypothetical protein
MTDPLKDKNVKKADVIHSAKIRELELKAEAE